jgi:UDP-N-acetylmuramyl pentapeptide phosphotransferase/UDP-N-acetylglucosamine-1-phosphate transferase
VLYLPLAIAFLTAVALAPALHRSLTEGGHVRENYRGTMLPCPLGLLILAAGFISLAPIVLVERFLDDEILHIDPYSVALVAGIGVLGLADDVFTGASRGWRGHGAAVLKGSFSTGALKAAGTVGLALYYASLTQPDDQRFLLSALVIVLMTNAFNLIDLRPGRAVKAFVLLMVALAIGSDDLGPLKALGPFVAPILVVGVYDVRERAMLGDTGSNVIGAVAGIVMVALLSDLKLAIAAGLLIAFTAYGEFRSISAFVERTPGFRHLDSIGRI